MEVITLNLEDEAKLSVQIQEAAEFLRAGKTVVYPTDTIYGLGCDALQDEAIRKILKIKGYQDPRPFSVMLRSVEAARQFVFFKSANERVMEKIFPGPFTVILPGARNISPLLAAGTGNLGVRIPRHPLTQALMDQFENPVVTTSVNEAGQEPLNDSFKIVEYFKDREFAPDLVLDGGRIVNGRPSIIIDLTGPHPQIKRSGTMTVAETLKLLQLLNA